MGRRTYTSLQVLDRLAISCILCIKIINAPLSQYPWSVPSAGVEPDHIDVFPLDRCQMYSDLRLRTSQDSGLVCSSTRPLHMYAGFHHPSKFVRESQFRWHKPLSSPFEERSYAYFPLNYSLLLWFGWLYLCDLPHLMYSL